MLSFIHGFSATLFYLLGSVFFLSYLLLTNELSTPWPRLALGVFDLPLIAVAVLYGGTSLYRSVRDPKHPSKLLALAIALPLLALFVFLAVLNFWTQA
jgi:hypothetical protein